MDPYMDPVAAETLAAGTQAPIMAMFSELRSFRSGDNLTQFEQLRRNSSGPVYHFEITDTAHFDFTDLPAFSPLASTLGLKGPINGDRALQIITDFTLAFFGEHLGGIEGNILQTDPSVYPEVIWR
jgi:hypothetical protein